MNLKYKWTQLKNWWFFFKSACKNDMNFKYLKPKMCEIRGVHGICEICTPKEWRAERNKKIQKIHKELVGDMFKDIEQFKKH